MNQPRSVEVVDTIRDMSQAPNVDLTPEQRMQIAIADAQLGLPIIELSFPESSEEERRVFQLARECVSQLGSARMAAFGKTHHANVRPENDAGLRALVETRAPIITLVGKASDRHARETLRVDPDTNLRIIRSSIQHIRDSMDGVRVIFDGEMASDGWAENPDYMFRVMDTAYDAGADTFVYCDTTGRDFTNPHFDRESGKLQSGVYELFQELRGRYGDTVGLGFHGHNDRGNADANTVAAVDAGASQVHVTWDGLAERTGMPRLPTVVKNLHLNGHSPVPEDRYQLLTPLANEVSGIIGVTLDPRAPYVGRQAFAHKAGMHTSGNRRTNIAGQRRAYEHVSPESVGNTRHVISSTQAGTSTVLELLDELTELPLELRDKLSQPEAAGILRDLMKTEGARGVSYEHARVSFLLRGLSQLGLFTPHFTVTHTSFGHESSDNSRGTWAEVGIETNGNTAHKRYESPHIDATGPVDAANTALQQALLQRFPSVHKLKLIDYKPTLLKKAGLASVVQAELLFSDGTEQFWTMGVHDNIVYASQYAYMDAVEYLLLKEDSKAKDGAPDSSQNDATAHVAA